MTAVRVNRKAADRVASGHPWIFESDVVDDGGAEPGSAVRVLDPKSRLLGTALWSSTSKIALRMVSSTAVAVDRDFFLGRLQAAAGYRAKVVTGTDAFRLVFSEADLLPGLIVDRYAGHFVVQALTQAMDRALPVICSAIEELFAPASILLRNDAPVRRHESLALETRTVLGDTPERVEVRMNGLRFEADLAHGQKTGVYLDQRENYIAAARYARGPALDCFTSTGGFALHLSNRCEHVLALDSSAPALAAAQRNARLNALENIEFREADVLDFLAAQAPGPRYSTIVLDPPAFTKSRSGIDGAARGYREINYRALRLLAPGGVLVTCSCSHHMSEAMLLEVVAAASLDAGKPLRVVERRIQAADHPILLTVPETLYLKCLILEHLQQ